MPGYVAHLHIVCFREFQRFTRVQINRVSYTLITFMKLDLFTAWNYNIIQTLPWHHIAQHMYHAYANFVSVIEVAWYMYKTVNYMSITLRNSWILIPLSGQVVRAGCREIGCTENWLCIYELVKCQLRCFWWADLISPINCVHNPSMSKLRRPDVLTVVYIKAHPTKGKCIGCLSCCESGKWSGWNKED